MIKHELKTWPEHYRNVVSGAKKVEIRSEADRSFKVDDILLLREYINETQQYTGNQTTVKVTHCLRGGPWLPDGFVALSVSHIAIGMDVAV